MATSKTVLITGASTGIGRATAELFERNGWQVVATMRSPAAGKHLSALDRVAVIKLDVTDEASIDTAVTAAVERFGGIDVLVNNAGFGLYGVLEAIPIADLRRQFETNVIGLLAVTRRVIPIFRRQHSGTVVNVSSIAGRITIPLCAPYCGSKFAVEGISEALTYEMRAIGVRVKIVEPGFIKTEFEASAEFIFNPSLTDYQEIAGKLGQSVGRRGPLLPARM